MQIIKIMDEFLINLITVWPKINNIKEKETIFLNKKD